MRLRRKILVGTIAVAGLLSIAGPAFAQEETPEPVALLGTQINLLWVVLGAVLVIFMQAGFALVETGFCRAKHAAHVVATNFAIFGLGFVGFFIVGYGFMFGGYSLPIIGLDTAPGEKWIGSGEWTVRNERCGSPSSSHTARTRSSVGSKSCSGIRARMPE